MRLAINHLAVKAARKSQLTSIGIPHFNRMTPRHHDCSDDEIVDLTNEQLAALKTDDIV
jgi:hypothetical protein